MTVAQPSINRVDFTGEQTEWLGGFNIIPASRSIKTEVDFLFVGDEVERIDEVLGKSASPYGVVLKHEGESGGSGYSISVTGSPNAVVNFLVDHYDGEITSEARREILAEISKAISGAWPSVGSPCLLKEIADATPGVWVPLARGVKNANLVTRIRSGKYSIDPLKYEARSYKESIENYGVEIMRITDEESSKTSDREKMKQRLRPIFDEMLEKAVDAAMMEFDKK